MVLIRALVEKIDLKRSVRIMRCEWGGKGIGKGIWYRL